MFDDKHNETDGMCDCSKVIGCFDMMGGKPGCHFNDGSVSPTVTRGRASVSDIHTIVLGKGK